MTSQQFILWLRGFTEGVHEYNVTPKQWTLLKERLDQVNDDEFEETPGMFQDHTLQSYPPYWSSDSPFRVTSLTGSGTVSSGFAVTTTPGISSITIANPNIASFGDLSISTSTSLPSGSTITFTNNGSPNWYATYFNDLKPDDNDR